MQTAEAFPVPGGFEQKARQRGLKVRSGGERGLRGSGAGTLGVPLGGTRRVGGLLGKTILSSACLVTAIGLGP